MRVISLSVWQASMIRRLVLLTGVATTLIVWPPLADPINFPKMFILLILGTWIFGTVVVDVIMSKTFRFSLGQWAILLFIVCLLIAALLTPVHYTAFFGANHRNDGALSYFAMAVLSFAAMMSFKPGSAWLVRNFVLTLGGILGFYGVLQSTKHDPFHWVLSYGPVIGTLGNPDFMSAILGVSAIAPVWILLKTKNWWLRIAAALVALMELYAVQKGGSSQGILAFGAGFVMLIVVRLWQIHKVAGIVSLVGAAIGAGVVLLGILNKGPLAAHIYQTSLKNRQDYWHGAIGMFKAHPLAGIGIDRLGEFYPQYAPRVQFVQGQGTDNAHSVFLQLMATGGLLVIIPYVLILLAILITALRGFFKARGQIQFDIAAMFALWFGLLLVSIVSIDNLGVAVWFWILGGALYGVSQKQIAASVVHANQPNSKGQSSKVQGGKAPKASKGGKNSNRSRKGGKSGDNSASIAGLVSLCMTILLIAVLLPMWGTQNALARVQAEYNKVSRGVFLADIDKAAKRKPVNTQTLITVTDLLLRMPEPDVALPLASLILEKDPRSLNGLNMSAYAHDIKNQFKKAIPFREKLLEYQPWQTKNMTDLVHDYMVTNQRAKAKALAAHIAELEPGSANAKTAATLLKSY
jgi:O-antigen ligase